VECVSRPRGRNREKADRVGRKHLREDLQLDFLLQRLPRRASFPSESALDENGAIPAADRQAAETGRRPRHQSRPYAGLPRSELAQAGSTRSTNYRGSFLTSSTDCWERERVGI